VFNSSLSACARVELISGLSAVSDVRFSASLAASGAFSGSLSLSVMAIKLAAFRMDCESVSNTFVEENAFVAGDWQQDFRNG
jgi:hypothetical protein